MIRQLGIILGIGTIAMTSTSVTLAAPLSQDPNTGIQNRANGSLSNLENRSVEKDFDQFFLESSQRTIVNYPGETIGERSQSQRNDQLLENIRIELQDDSSNEASDIFPNSRHGDYSDRSQILYEVEEW